SHSRCLDWTSSRAARETVDEGLVPPAEGRRVKRVEKRTEEKKPTETARTRGPSPAPTAVPGTRDGAAADGAAPEELDQVVSMLGDMDIEVDAVEETALAEEPEKAAETEWVEEQPEAEETERA